jgi:hypothetical protein
VFLSHERISARGTVRSKNRVELYPINGIFVKVCDFEHSSNYESSIVDTLQGATEMDRLRTRPACEQQRRGHDKI